MDLFICQLRHHPTQGSEHFPTIFHYNDPCGKQRKSGLTLSVGVVDPLLLGLCWRRRWFLLNCLLHDAAGVLHGALLQHTRAPLHAADHDNDQHQQEQQHYHPGQVLVDVKVIMGARPWGAPASWPVVAGNPSSTTTAPLPSYLADTCPNPLYPCTLKTLHCPLAGTWHRVRTGLPLLELTVHQLLASCGRWSP